MRLDRPQINSCQVFDKIKVDLAVSPLKKINGKDKCAKIGGIFHGRRVSIANCGSMEWCLIGSKIDKFETACMLRLTLDAEFGTESGN